MVRRGLARSREQARDLIVGNRVRVSGAFAVKPGRQTGAGEAIDVSGPPERFVSRAGAKLDAALDTFGVDVAGLRVLDAGASTGGFTDCLLQRGAAQVLAIDVGRGQLDAKLRGDPRVDVRERVNVRHLGSSDVGERVDAITADLSFISLQKVLDPLLAVARPGAPLLLLVKPQFEAGRAEADRGQGVITDPAVWRRVLGEVNDALAARGATIMGVMRSPIRGVGGNVEFVLYARAPSGRGGRQLPAAELDLVIDQAGRQV